MMSATATPYSSAGGGEAGEALVTVFPLRLRTLSVESHLIVGAGAGDDCSARCAKVFAICNTERLFAFAASPASGAATGICSTCGSCTGAGAGGWLVAACVVTPTGARLCMGTEGGASCGLSSARTTAGILSALRAASGAERGAGAQDCGLLGCALTTPVADSGRRMPPVVVLLTPGITGCCAPHCVPSLRTLGSPRPWCTSTLGAADTGLGCRAGTSGAEVGAEVDTG